MIPDHSSFKSRGNDDHASATGNLSDQSPAGLAARIRQFASEVGFSLAGIAPVAESSHAAYLRQWVEQGAYGQMHYLARTIDGRINLQSALPWARSVVCVGMAYYQPPPREAPLHGDVSAIGEQENAAAPERAKIARYAWGRDYHRVIYGRLRQLERMIRRAAGQPFESRSYVDTGPCSERELAVRAGLGWIGKNTLLIHPRHGSWFVLGELVTSLDLPADEPQADHCGTCTRCLDACPTSALTPYRLDSMRCISYQTLENRGDIPPSLHPAMHKAGFIVGCDICQEVCPFNRRPLAASVADFAIADPAPAINPRTVMAWTAADWDAATRGRAFRRAKTEMWRRNAGILIHE